ncbi:MAG: hypothetical protein JO262_02490 [Solirubrobacterales bacterium]|nr:hypothetical protein [Solirubrobacterales bacterium]
MSGSSPAGSDGDAVSGSSPVGSDGGAAGGSSPAGSRTGAASAWIASQTLRLYPLAYRRRYGDEMRALLEDSPVRPITALDLLRGALVAHLRPADAPAGAVEPADRIRATAGGVLMCWIFFAAAGFGFYKSTEDYPFSLAGHAHPLLRDAHLAVQALAVIASATVVLGALPLIAAALALARREPSRRRAVVLPFLPVVVFVLITGAVIALAHVYGPNASSGVGNGVAVLWGIAGVGCGVTCVLACRAALFATPTPASRLRAALVAGTLVTVAMIAIAAATAIYALALWLDAAQLAGDPNGPFGLLSVSASLILQVIVMLAAGALAATTTVRGWRAENQLSPA